MAITTPYSCRLSAEVEAPAANTPVLTEGRARLGLTSELQRGVLDPLLQASHGLYQLLMKLLDNFVQQASILEAPPEGKCVI